MENVSEKDGKGVCMMDSKKTKIRMRFTQQQLEVLDRLKKEGKFGDAYPEIVLNVFREYTKRENKNRGS